MSIYEEKHVPDEIVGTSDPYSSVSEQLATLMDFNDSVIYLTNDIEDDTLVDFMIRVRAIIGNRTEQEKDMPINIIINSLGGDIHAMLGIIDYIESLSVKVNTICRGKAFSAAAIILACGTGSRMMSKRSSVMFHQSSSFLDGKMSDIAAYLDNIKNLETTIYDLLADRTKKDADWWRDKMKSDLFLSTNDLIEYGVIDQII